MLWDFLNSIDLDFVFWFCALSGTGLLIFQFFLGFGGYQIDVLEGDALQFKWLSKQALTGFLMMFGWVGLSCKKELEFSALNSVAFAFLAASVTLILVAYFFKIAKSLKSDGVVFRLEDTLGKEAIVYQRIPKKGVGKITVILHQLSYEIEAISQDGEEISSFTQVQIVNKVDDKTVVVASKR